MTEAEDEEDKRAMLATIMKGLHGLTREIDEQILWPAIKRQTPDLAYARGAYLIHALRDNGWRSLGEKEIRRRVGRLR